MSGFYEDIIDAVNVMGHRHKLCYLSDLLNQMITSIPVGPPLKELPFLLSYCYNSFIVSGYSVTEQY
jgi:hypothetical protein